MKDNLIQFFNRLIGDSDVFTVEQRNFHFLTLFASIVLLCEIFLALLFQLPTNVILLLAAALPLPISDFYLSRQKGYFQFAAAKFILTGYILNCSIWFYADGIHGPVYLTLFILFLWSIIIAKKHLFSIWIGNVILISALTYLDAFHPELQQWKSTTELHYIYLLYLPFVIFSLSTLVVLMVFKSSYQEEKRKVEDYNSKLKLTVADLTESNQMRDTLFSLISHDMRSLSGSVKGFSDLLMEEASGISTENKELLHYINRSSDELHGMLVNLLNWSQIQMDKLSPQKELLEVEGLIEKCVRYFNPQITEKTLNVKLRNQPNLYIHADFQMVLSSLRNIISNAIKFTPNGNTIFVVSRQTEAGLVEIRIADQGIGMSQDEVQKLLNKNQTFTKFGTQNEKGTGIGFSIAARFLELNNAQIHVASIPGEGSTFSMTFPSTPAPVIQQKPVLVEETVG